MAAKKTSKIAPKVGPLKTSTAALMHGYDAFGAKYIKPGFAFTPEMDLAFALGYPHYIELADGHPADEDPMGAGLRFIQEEALIAHVWPRDIASRAARSFPFLRLNNEKRTQAFSKGGPIGQQEARDIVFRWLRCNHAGILLLLLEAFVGSEAVVDAAVTAMESFEQAQWTSTFFDTAIITLGLLLYRVPEEAATRARSRLYDIRERTRIAGWQSEAINNIDLVLNGAEGAERSAPRYDDKHIAPFYTTLAVDDPTWVTRTILSSGPPENGMYPDPRPSFLGTNDVLDAECSWWRKYTAPGAHATFIERFGHIQSDALLPVFLEMTTASNAKKQAMSWFGDNLEFARGFLEKTVGSTDGERAKAARAALGQCQ